MRSGCACAVWNHSSDREGLFTLTGGIPLRLATLVLATSLAASNQALSQTVSPYEATAVSASAGRTWDAVVDMFASRGIPILAMDSDKGFIATDQVEVNVDRARKWAECGRRYFGSFGYYADRAIYNVFVRGDSAASTVKVTVRWTKDGVADQTMKCRTTNVWESELEAAIKLGAETVVRRDATPVKASASRTWDAVVDVLASRRIPIRTMDRASGSIAIDETGVGHQEALFAADRATGDVFVRGDSAASTVKVSVRWTRKGAADELMERNTRNALESALETEIKLSAEAVIPLGVTPVSAPYGRTWDAVVDVFASRGIPIRKMERAGGFVATDQVGVAVEQAMKWATDCGRTYLIVPLDADRAIYSVVVRGNNEASTVKVRIRWTQGGRPDDPQIMECSTTHVREHEMEAAIKLGAETVIPSDATPVSASFGRTWDAVVDVLASRGVPIRTMDRANGFIATDQLSIEGKQPRQWADCGRVLGFTLAADRATYNVFVRGDSAASTVKVAVHWTYTSSKGDPEWTECKTKNVRESEMEAAIKLGAEAH